MNSLMTTLFQLAFECLFLGSYWDRDRVANCPADPSRLLAPEMATLNLILAGPITFLEDG